MDDPDIVYIGRGSKWGNMYSHKKGTKAAYWVETREKAINAFKQQLWSCIKAQIITIDDLLELDGKRLACYCSPQACHGDVLVKAVEWAKKEKTKCIS